MATTPPVLAVRWTLLALVIGLAGYFGWHTLQEDPADDAAAEERVIFPQPAYTPKGAEALTAGPSAEPSATPEAPAGPSDEVSPTPDADGSDPSATSGAMDADATVPEHLRGDNPLRLDGVIGSYSTAPGPVRTLVRLTDRNGYLRGTDADFRVKHAVITCERVAHQGWTWEQQVSGDVANGIAEATAQEFADLLASDFCPSLGL